MNHADRSRLLNIARDLNIPSGRWVLAGSGAMVMHGIDRTMRDVDIFCATATWLSIYSERYRGHPWEVFATDPDDTMRRCDPPYLYRTMHDIEVNVFQSWRKRGVGDIDTAFWIHNAEMVGDIPCVSLQFLLDWKIEVGRSKDIADIALLKARLEGAQA
jgi:hypothetical protein